MAVDVKKVANRRPVHYNSLDEFVTDAESLGQGPVRALGNWSYEQILAHLAFAMNGSIDGIAFKIPWHVRSLARLLRKPILKRGLRPGFRLSQADDSRAFPDNAAERDAGLECVRKAVARLLTEIRRSPHPVLGALTKEEWNIFHLRHCELHMSFVVPA